MGQDRLRQMIADKTARIGVIGLGHVGLPLAVEFAKSGFYVRGFDTSPGKTELLSRGSSYIADVSAVDLGVMVKSGHLVASSDPADLSDCNVAIICVPTPLNEYQEPDTSMIAAAGRMARENLAVPALVVLESTSYPGTTEEILLPALSDHSLVIDKDIFVAFSSERIDPGNLDYKVRDIPKLAAGVTPESSELAVLLYEQAVSRVIPAPSVRAAESAKLLENVFRAINIALIDELKMVFDRLGLDIWEVIELAATKPFGYVPFFPGPGVGGDCIPVDPHYLANKARQQGLHLRFIELAQDIFDTMPRYVVEQVGTLLNSNKKALNDSSTLLVGITYKANVPDLSNTPAEKVARLLLEKGCRVEYHDPLVPEAMLAGKITKSTPLTKEKLKKFDCVVILANHNAIDFDLIAKHAGLVVDTRHALASDVNGKVVH